MIFHSLSQAQRVLPFFIIHNAGVYMYTLKGLILFERTYSVDRFMPIGLLNTLFFSILFIVMFKALMRQFQVEYNGIDLV